MGHLCRHDQLVRPNLFLLDAWCEMTDAEKLIEVKRLLLEFIDDIIEWEGTLPCIPFKLYDLLGIQWEKPK